MLKLKTCPFCGGNALLSHLSNEYNDSYSVSCTGELNGDCAGLEGTPFYDTAEDAVSAWNTRANAKILQEIEEREAAVCPEGVPFDEYILFLKDEINKIKAVTGF